MKKPPTSKTILTLVVIGGLIFIAWLFMSHRADKNVAPVQVSENAPLPSADNWPSAKLRDVTVTDNASYYTISATYPVAKDDVISGYFKTFVDDSIAQFKSDTSWAAGNGTAAPAEAGALSLHITYSEQKNARVDNYIFHTTTYTGGAHDLQSTTTFSFSATGQQITLATLFTNGINGLGTVAPYVKAQLTSAPGADQTMINDGTAPTEVNYQNFTVQDDGVIFLFDPYQVAPYSAGAQSVKVPVSVFKSIANPTIFPTQ